MGLIKSQDILTMVTEAEEEEDDSDEWIYVFFWGGLLCRANTSHRDWRQITKFLSQLCRYSHIVIFMF